MTTLANQDSCDKRATRKRIRKVGIIVGCQRTSGTFADLIAMARNGVAVIKDGPDYRLAWSEAFETERIS